MSVIGTFILDFQTVDFEPDSKIAIEVLSSLQSGCEMSDSYAMDEPLSRAGWSFAKMFLAGQFVECIYQHHRTDIDSTKGKKFEDKFVGWLANELRNKGCGANVKMAPEMKSPF